MSNVEQPQIKEPTIKKDRGISPLWIFTALAFLLAGWLLYRSVSEAGERIEIQFTDAQGIEAGRTTIRYQGLEVGMIRKINLADDLQSITAEADIYPEATKILKKDTVFWVVKPKASITGISGLDALVSGNYIAVFPGAGDSQTRFVAAEEAPPVAFDDDSMHVVLEAPDLGSLSIGSGVYYKKIRVGEVYDYRLTKDKTRVKVSLKVKKEHASLVTEKSRFWNVSGVSADVSLSGVDVKVENLASVLAGGVAFDSPMAATQAPDMTTFQLYRSINDTDRGIPITINLPANHNIKNHEAPIVYQGLEVGRLNDISFNKDFTGTIAKANIDPAMAWLLKSNSEFIIEAPQLNFDGLKNLPNLFTGNTLSITPGDGDETHEFTAKSTDSIMASDPRALTVSLSAENAWGLGRNTKILYRGMQVGFVNKTALNDGSVSLDVIIDPQYKHLVKSQTRFFIVGGVTGQITSEGVEFIVPAVAQMAEPAISFTSEGEAKVRDDYTLFKSEIQARNAQDSLKGYRTLTLIAAKLPSVSEGSPVMYKNFTVGKVEGFQLAKNSVEVQVKIENRYHHLISDKTVFWNQSGVDIKASLSGVHIDTGSLKSIVSGGISFGDIQGIDNKNGRHWKLYDSLTDAQNYGLKIAFTADEANGLSAGSKIRYQGVDVGEVTDLSPAFQYEGVIVNAILYPEYSSKLAKATSYFWVAQPTLSLTKTENLDSLFGAYISVVPGNGKLREEFQLHNAAEYKGGLTLVLESENRGSVNVGTPILFRDFEVGTVTDVRLGRFADRVLIEVKISDDYKHLVRNNTVFWNRSGVDVSIGLTGATVRSGTIESILKGGIAFATPEGEALAAPARSDQHYLLHREAKSEWESWRTAIPEF
ncbi:PqiB family protein [Enterovibrio norvegicus]|uniref:PqiB family protein n=1 Tax=Enterovibrio norvegicus TaxID=188144 RepID=UPI000C839EA1|nr:MlaD family protein [Enterovibrio norvegicus]MCC4796940.1 MlaD family protein [Enterovibrio norvegicus]PMI27494.1 paraquat-inducible protein B [Enterovibrio norvegicus]TKF13450.1 MCE family protein [Enterovibrio norvegicus]TKF34055.1 MCE family protein [Enterovibrio norvegicus]